MTKSETLFLLILGFLLSNNTFGQVTRISGRLVNEINTEPIGYALIHIKGESANTITNSDGYFILSGNFSTNDSIVFSHLAYNSKTFIVSGFQKEQQVIYLTPKTFTIDEITVLGGNVVDQLKDAIAQSLAKLKLPLRLETYYREFVKTNNQYTKFSDGLIDYELSGETDDPKTRVFVQQSRANELKSETDKDIDWNLNSPLDIKKMVHPFFFNAIGRIVENAEKYEFHASVVNEKNSSRLIKIKFNPKPDIKELLYQGDIVIDEQSKLILSYDYGQEQNPTKTSKIINVLIFKTQMNRFEVRSLFRLNQGNYQPWYTNTRAEFRFWNNKKLDVNFAFSSDLLVNNAVGEPFNPHSNKNSYSKKSLYPLGSNYQSEFWTNQNTIQLTDEEEKIVSKLKQ